MKKYIAILILSFSVFGLLFAATSSKNINNGNKVIIITTIDQIYPIYSITASNSDTSVTSGNPTDASIPSITAIKVYDANKVLTDIRINIGLNHFGYQNNDAEERIKAPIRYASSINVTIEAKALENQDQETANHVKKSDEPAVVDGSLKITTSADAADFEATANSIGNKVSVKAEYKSGLSVFAEQIAECTFDWDVTKLTAGDTYEAGVIVTYEII